MLRDGDTITLTCTNSFETNGFKFEKGEKYKAVFDMHAAFFHNKAFMIQIDDKRFYLSDKEESNFALIPDMDIWSDYNG